MSLGGALRFNLSIWNQVFSSVQTGLNTFDKVCKKSQLIGSSLGRSEAAYGLLWTHAAPCFFRQDWFLSIHQDYLASTSSKFIGCNWFQKSRRLGRHTPCSL